MKIKETIERDCCHPSKDLKPLLGPNKPNGQSWLFCTYCGRHWYDYGMGREPDSTPQGLEPLTWPWEK